MSVSCLQGLSEVRVRQKHTMFTDNKYVITTPSGDVVLQVKEEANSWGRALLGSERAFRMNLFDVKDQQVVSLRRPYTFAADKMEVSIGNQVVAIIRQEMTLMTPKLVINDPRDRRVMKIKGPALATVNYDYKVYNTNDQQIGLVAKRWSGAVREMFTTADSYVIRFPADLHVNYKAALIAACLLIDFMFFES